MKRNIKTFGPLLCLAITSVFLSCKDYLNAKPDTRLAVITSIKEMQAMLDYFPRMNYNDPSVSVVCADEYFNTDAVYNARKESERNLYRWAPQFVFEQKFNAWQDVYEIIYFANVVLNAVDENRGILNTNELTTIAAQAKFHRGRQFLNAIDIWTMPYNAATATAALGVPLRLTADFNIASKRASLAESYQQVISDLTAAVAGLPSTTITPMRPSKAAAYGMLARTYIRMNNYKQAERYADSCLQFGMPLMDFNTLNASAPYPIAQMNKEVIFESRAIPLGPITNARALVNPLVYGSYENNDLRKTVYFKPSGTNFLFKGQYAGSSNMFTGIAVDEMLLTRAECYARQNKISDAITDMNMLLLNRYKTGSFTPINNLSQADLITLIKKERLKELFLRGQRWADIRRWNVEGDGITLERTIAGENVKLLPNSLLYAIAIPEDIIALANIKQNER